MKYTINANPTLQQKPLTVIFCLPGNNFSNDFLCSWSELILWCVKNNIRPIMSSHYDAVVYYVRNKCLGGDVRRGKNQKPYNGQISYDYMMWVDSDIVFTPDHFKKLLERNLPIISGLYLMQGGTHYATVVDWDEKYFEKNGTFQFAQPKDFQGKTNPIEVDYTGFGFILAKYGVFESLEYPWFRPIFYNIGNAYDFCSEDVGICKLLKAAGNKIYIDPTVKVGHQKRVIL
jgi:hypothetical protein